MIITIFPNELYRRWEVTLEALNMAKKLTMPTETQFQMVGYTQEPNDKVKVIGLGNWTSYKDEEARSVIKDENFLYQFQKNIRTLLKSSKA